MSDKLSFVVVADLDLDNMSGVLLDWDLTEVDSCMRLEGCYSMGAAGDGRAPTEERSWLRSRDF